MSKNDIKTSPQLLDCVVGISPSGKVVTEGVLDNGKEYREEFGKDFLTTVNSTNRHLEDCAEKEDLEFLLEKCEVCLEQ